MDNKSVINIYVDFSTKYNILQIDDYFLGICTENTKRLYGATFAPQKERHLF